MLMNITTRKTPRLSANRIVVRCFLYLVGVFPRLLWECYFSVLLQHRRRYHPRRRCHHRCRLYAPQRWKILARTKWWTDGFNVIPTAIHVMQDILFQMVDVVILLVVSVEMAAIPAMCIRIHAFV